MMKIEKVNWIDAKAQEAEVIISDGVYSVTCFSCPLELQEQGIFNDTVHCLDVENIQKSFETSPLVKKGKGFYEYVLRGKFEDGIVRIGGLQIDISNVAIPADIADGDVIEFNVSRLDIY